MCSWKRMTREEMAEELCKLYDKNNISYVLDDVKKLSEEELMDEMAEYADI